MSGNPVDDAMDYFRQLEWEARTRTPKSFKCDFCKRIFYEGGLRFEFEDACDDCVNDGTVKAEFRENGMDDGFIEKLFIHAVKIEH